MTDLAPAAPAGAVDIRAQYEAAMQGAMEAPTPQARSKFVDKMALLAPQLPAKGTIPAVDPITNEPTSADDKEDGFERPASPFEYTLENALPVGTEIVDRDGFASLKTSLFEMGVPAPIASGAFAEIAQLTAQGVFANDASYEAQLSARNTAMMRVHGAENYAAMIEDGFDHVQRAVASGKISKSTGEAIVASPMALSHAALLARHGTRAARR